MERLGRRAGEGDQHGHVERKAREQYWPGTLMAFGLIAFLATFWVGQSVTFITFGAMFRWLALFCFAGNLLPYMRSGLALGMERFEWFLFNLLAIGPFVFSLLLWTNFAVHDAPRTYVLDGNPSRIEVLAYWHEHGELPPGRRLEEIAGRLREDERVRGSVMGPMIAVARGALGYDIIDRWETNAYLRVEELP